MNHDTWKPIPWYCVNCGNKVVGMMNAKEVIKVECHRCKAVMMRSFKKPAKHRQHDNTLRDYSEEILNYFRSRLTNAICEGINSMIQAAKRKARGYHTFEGFSSMIYLIAAKLQLACPNPLR